jgi:UDP-N-acetylmuramoylalanine--D-glutamate ligase
MSVRRNLVLGLGKTGLSVTNHLLVRGEAVIVNDSRESPPGLRDLEALKGDVVAYCGTFDIGLLEGVDRVVLSPGISRAEPIVRAACAAQLPLVGDIELFSNAVDAPVVAITGTNGKSTVTTLVADMAQRAGRRVLAGGNLGRPALDLLMDARPELYVLELSSYQLEVTSSLRPVAAAVLNLTPDHMDRYDSLSSYAAAKERIFIGSEAAIYNADDPIVSQMDMGSAVRVGFSTHSTDARFCLRPVGETSFLTRDGVGLMATDELRIPGTHNAANALAALAIGSQIGLSDEAMVEALRTFTGLSHRAQLVAEHNGVRFIDDSKGTNVGATIAAVHGLGAPIVLIAGGDGKGQDFAPLAQALKDRVRHAVLIGKDRGLLADALRDVCGVEFAEDMDGAVVMALRAARGGDLVLLSPACASFDMYRDYTERGAAFAAAARRVVQ